MRKNRVSSSLVVFSLVLVLPQISYSKDQSQESKTGSSQGISGDPKERRNRSKKSSSEPAISEVEEIRTINGVGNNTNNPNWGAAFTHLQRIAPADYGDGIASLAGSLRPSARVVSNAVAAQGETETIPNPFGTSDILWQWGQFLDHDIDLTDGSPGEPAPIVVPLGDSYFDPQGTGNVVIPFSRALFDPLTGTDASNPREQENEITSWIDGSMVYGPDEERTLALRVGPDSPFLRTSTGGLLPFNIDGLTNANGFVADPTSLFLAGDVRANEQVGLAVFHTLFVREHNRLAQEIAQSNPILSGDDVFEQARRLVIAQIQHITYREFLPALLGAKALKSYRGYKEDINPTIFNEFSAAAYRLGHSMLSDQILRLDATGASIAGGPLPLRDAFFAAPTILQERNDLDPILRGLASQTHQRIDNKVVSGIRNFLFGAPGQGGLDLASLNIQRGRDHGLASYNETREALGLARVSDFDEITSDATLAQALAQTYGTVDDIDLWVGGLAEDPLLEQGSQLGLLFHTILVQQFTLLRDGDRFWYERDLSKNDLDRVRKMSLADFIRLNTGIGDELQDYVFYVPDAGPNLKSDAGQKKQRRKK